MTEKPRSVRLSDALLRARVREYEELTELLEKADQERRDLLAARTAAAGAIDLLLKEHRHRGITIKGLHYVVVARETSKRVKPSKYLLRVPNNSLFKEI